MTKDRLLVLFVLMALLVVSGVLHAQPCRVMDPELQDAYSGPCVDGYADGRGSASGTARYEGGFRAGRKHGQGVKRWPNGDRYEGGFVDDRRQGFGLYVFGRGPWAGERYEGEFANNRRHGAGSYRWSSGDVYQGPWKDDVAVGPPTAMMRARAKAEEETRAAVAQNGRSVCREMAVGIALREWIRGVVVDVAQDKVAVRIDDTGVHPHVIAGSAVEKAAVLWDSPLDWIPCW